MKKTITISTLFILGLACGGDTGRRRTSFELEASGANGKSTNAHGFTIELTRAEVTIEQVLFFEGDPLFAERVWQALFAPRTAYAHPGHYVEGAALADFLEPVTIDLLAGPTTLGMGNGVTGDYNSAEVRMTSALLEGTATKDGVTVAFSANVALEDDLRGIAFGAIVEGTTGRIEMVIDMARWLDRADFSGEADGPIPFDSQPYSALARGLVNTASFTFSWREIL